MAVTTQAPRHRAGPGFAGPAAAAAAGPLSRQPRAVAAVASVCEAPCCCVLRLPRLCLSVGSPDGFDTAACALHVAARRGHCGPHVNVPEPVAARLPVCVQSDAGLPHSHNDTRHAALPRTSPCCYVAKTLPLLPPVVWSGLMRMLRLSMYCDGLLNWWLMATGSFYPGVVWAPG